MATLWTSIKHAWNIFTDQEPSRVDGMNWDTGPSYSARPDRERVFVSNERTIISSIYNRLSIDVAANDIRHVRLDADDRYLEDISSSLNECLNVEPNIDQGPRHFKQDIASSLFHQGVIAIVPVDYSTNPNKPEGLLEIRSLRVGRIVKWNPQTVRVNVYNELTGRREEVTVLKKHTAIVENPLYAVMNEPNSTLKRLTRKLALLDNIDEKSSSNKLDLIIQLPFQVRSETKKQQAAQRLSEIEFQLKGSQYGIAYADATEKITQLNRPVENNLLTQIEYLVKLLYAELGLTPEIMSGTADEKAMINYNNRTVKPVVAAIVEAMHRTFLTKTARSQKQAMRSFRDPFELVPMSEMAELADKLTRNEVLSSNELRQFMGVRPSKDPAADQLRNSNMPQSDTAAAPVEGEVEEDESEIAMNEAFDEMEAVLDGIFEDLGVSSDAD